ncbi:MAG: YoaK family protein [Stellaceae bacterium]
MALFESLLLAALLALGAGFVDAYGYIGLGHVFVANMTGTTVLLGVAAAHGDGGLAGHYILTVGAFAAGALIGALLKRLTGRGSLPLLLGGAVLVMLVIVPPSRVAALVLLAAVMGLQGSAVARFRSISLQTIVITGTIVRLAEGVVTTALGDGKAEPHVHEANIHHALTWSGYLIGAGAGGLALERLGVPLLPPACAMLVAGLLLALIEARDPEK